MNLDHDEQNCPNWLNFIHLVKNSLIVEHTPKNQNLENKNLGTYFLEYNHI